MTEDALQHIAKAKRKKSNWLDLTDCGIADSLPEEVAEMVWLEELNLSQNPLTAAVLEAVSKVCRSSAGLLCWVAPSSI